MSIGGFHQASKNQAYGSSYINDVVLAITELLKRHYRVVYINIGFAYCDTVQKVFYNSDRVMMISFYHNQNKHGQNTDWAK